MPNSRKFKVVLIGDANVGKTSLLNKLISNYCNNEHNPTVGTNCGIWTFPKKDDSISLQIWDTAGEERYRALGSIFYRNADAGLLIYSQSDPESSKSLHTWLECFRKIAGDNVCVAVIANKSDLKKEESTEIKDWAYRENLLFFEASAKTGQNVTEIFSAIAQEIQNKMICLQLSLNSNLKSIKLQSPQTSKIRPRSAFLC